MEMVESTTATIESEVKEIAKLLSRAAKNYQMYLSNNQMFRTSLETLKSALAEFLEETVTTEAVQRVDIRARVTGFLEQSNFGAGVDVPQWAVLSVIERSEARRGGKDRTCRGTPGHQ